MIYLITFTVACLMTACVTPLSLWVGRRFMLTDQPGGRRKHRNEMVRVGGIAIFAGFFGAGLMIFGLSRAGLWPPMGAEDEKLLTGVMVGTLFIFIFGLLDDWFEFGSRPQFLGHFTVALIAINFDVVFERATLPFLGETPFGLLTYPLTVFWVMGMLNTVNWLDGLDGLAAGVTAIAGLVFAIHAYQLGQTMVALFPLALTAASLGFLPFNFHPAKLFMGSSGSLVLGFALASLSILAPAKVATALLVLGIPILDVAWLIIYRWRHRGNPLVAGRDHLHYRLQDLGWSQPRIVLSYYAFCTIFGLLALLISAPIYKLIALLLMSGGTLLILWWLARDDKFHDS